jgi:hypothetical protein
MAMNIHHEYELDNYKRAINHNINTNFDDEVNDGGGSLSNDPPPDIGGYPGGPQGPPYGGGRTEIQES